MWWLIGWWVAYGYVLWRWHPRKQGFPPEADGYPETTPPKNYERPISPVSVLIPARNEGESLPATLKALQSQSLLPLEALVIDDGSTDDTAQLVSAWQTQMPFSLKCLRSEGEGKKAALRTGLKAAQGAIIVTLDADTVPTPEALEKLVRPFHSGATQMSAAYVRFWDESVYASADWGRRFLLAFQALEMAGILALTAGSWQRGEPITVNGAFLAYRRQAYEAVGGWGNVPHPGGDDELLMQRIYQCYGPEALVFSGALAQTRPARTWREFWHQRRRWLTKYPYHRLFWTRAGLMLLGLTHLLFWVILLLSPAWALAHLLITGILQAYIIRLGMQAMKLPPFLWGWYPLAQMAYPIYVLLLSLQLLRKGFWWRGRWYSS